MALQKRAMHASMAYSGPEGTTQRAENWSHPAPAANRSAAKGSLLRGCPGRLFTLAAQLLADAAHGAWIDPSPALWLIPLPWPALLCSAVPALPAAAITESCRRLEGKKQEKKTLVHL